MRASGRGEAARARGSDLPLAGPSKSKFRRRRLFVFGSILCTGVWVLSCFVVVFMFFFFAFLWLFWPWSVFRWQVCGF